MNFELAPIDEPHLGQDLACPAPCAFLFRDDELLLGIGQIAGPLRS